MTENAFMQVVEIASRASDSMSHAETTAANIASMYSEQQAEYTESTTEYIQTNDVDPMTNANETDTTKYSTQYQVDANSQSAGMSAFSSMTSRAEGDVGTFSDAQGSMFDITSGILDSLDSVTSLLA